MVDDDEFRGTVRAFVEWCQRAHPDAPIARIPPSSLVSLIDRKTRGELTADEIVAEIHAMVEAANAGLDVDSSGPGDAVN